MRLTVRMRNILVLSLVGLMAWIGEGCLGGISLFSSSHTHYETKPGIEERLKDLEQRVQRLERSERSGQTYSVIKETHLNISVDPYQSKNNESSKDSEN